MGNYLNDWRGNGLLLVASFFIVILPVESLAQVTIEEELKLSAQNPHKQKSTNDQLRLLSHTEPPQLVATKAGKLGIYLHELLRYKDAVPDSAALIVHIFNRDKDQTKRFPVKQYLDTALVSQSTYGCRDYWYLYGNGPFTYTRTTWHPSASEGMVYSAHGQRKGWSDNWESFDYRNKNYAGARKLFLSWEPPETDHNDRRPDPAIFQTFMDFNFSIPSYVKVKEATLTLEQNQIIREEDDFYLEPDKYIYLHKVNSAWNSSSLTWNNRPGVTGDPMRVKKSSRYVIGDFFYVWYDIDVTSFAKEWVANPEKYHGIRFSLKGGDGKDRIIFVSGENHEYERPVINVKFTNPRWSRENSVIPVGNVSKGDTVRFTYDNLGPPQDYSNVSGPTNFWGFDGIENVIDTSKVKEGYALSFLNRHKSSFCESRWMSTEFLGAFAFIEGTASDKIMLGETKYYAAKWKDPAKKENITIEEVESSGGEPVAPNGVISGAFSGNPIEVVSGGKSGVYWERKWATVNSDGSISSGNLPSGMIRVVGRYWEDGKDYKVKLKAEAASGDGELEIKVVKPDRLGNKYDQARDVFDEAVDMDSVITANAGKYGIPPQFIKGQMRKETPPKEFHFSDGSKNGFPPAFRYEPFNWEFTVRKKKDIRNKPFSSNPFWVTENSMGVDTPPKHQYVRYYSYPQTPITVWGMVNKYSHLTDVTNFSLYGKRESDGKMNFSRYGYTPIQKIYDDFLDDLKVIYSGDSLYSAARDTIANFLKNEWKGPEKLQPESFKGGLKNLTAQTRIASSYGLMQIWYVTATERGYEINSDQLPEKLNEIESFFPFAMDFHIKNLKKVKDLVGLDAKDWEKGYEMIWQKVFNYWNPGMKNYEEDITRFSLEFKPQKDS